MDTPELAAPVLVGVIGVIVGAPKVDVPVEKLLGGGGHPEVPEPGGKTPEVGGAVFHGLLVFRVPGAAPALLEGNCTCCPDDTEPARIAIAKTTKTKRYLFSRGAIPRQ